MKTNNKMGLIVPFFFFFSVLILKFLKFYNLKTCIGKRSVIIKLF